MRLVCTLVMLVACGRIRFDERNDAAGSAVDDGDIDAVTLPTSCFTKVAPGHLHMCALLGTQALCWGLDDGGQTGRGFAGGVTLNPFLVPGQMIDIGAGGHFTCFLATDNTTSCVGANTDAQLARGTTTPFEATPFTTVVPPLSSLVAGARHACGEALDGTAFCWGCVDYAAGTDCASNTTFLVNSGVARVLHGARRGTCHTTGGVLACWGQNENGQLGDGSMTARSLYGQGAEVTAADNLVTVVQGRRHACGLHTDRTVSCWGLNDEAQLGRGIVSGTELAGAPVGGLTDIVQLVTGRAHSCALEASGKLFCWGAGAEGQIGDGGGVGRATPQLVLEDVATVGAATGTTCAARPDGLYCWGRNGNGEVGDGTMGTNRLLPVRILTCP